MILYNISICAAVLLTVVLSSPNGAEAQRAPDASGRFNAEPRREPNIPGDFDYYTLVMSWSPTHCASDDGSRDDAQCNRRDGRRYAFVLHGLWPQYEKGFPLSCRTARRPFVPEAVIDGIRDIMPSRGLVIHEFRAHGTCSGLAPVEYYELARRLFKSTEIPRRYQNPFETQFVAPDDLMDDFIAENPSLKPDMIAVSCGGTGNRLRDVRICLTKEGVPRSCGGNEDQRRLCSAERVYVPPVRSTRPDGGGDRDAPATPGDRQRSPLPGPRMIDGSRPL